MTLDKRYNHLEIEENKYRFWLDGGYFKQLDYHKPPFSMVIPPPNVTGKLHLGHAWNTTVQDIIARYKRLQGFDVLWVPGMDHAGIATQAVVEAHLKKSGETRTSLGREKFLAKVWEWKDRYAANIRQQWAKMGLSLNYNYERFTLDEGLNEAVNKVFVDLYHQGLIYRGEKIINWDPEQKTAISNIEVEHKEIEGKLYYVAYRLTETLAPLFVATTRPETMFADVCLVVNPKDERYKHLIGQTAVNPSNQEVIPIIGDEYVDIEFGTGVMKCTPAHDPNDFALGQKYDLAMPICMNKDGTMNELAGEFAGLDRFVCRQKLIEKIKKEANLLKIESIIHAVGFSERSGAMIEPYLSKQWFVKMKPLAEEVLKAQSGPDQIKFFPDRFNKTFIDWINKVEDWTISRQLWWGHQIPAYYHKVTGEVYVGLTPPVNIKSYIQDEDVLDTWFSSALWPFSTLGWPQKTLAYNRYYPTDVLVTAYDIIFFWIARMAFQGVHFTKKLPFKDVYITGLIRDEQGRKMSKSLGNGVDPMDVIARYGTDALRYFLATNSSPGADLRYSEEKINSSVNYLNKIWNASRYILMALPNNFKSQPINFAALQDVDKHILIRLNATIGDVTSNLDKYELGMASTYLYNFVYDEFCSWYLEFSKVTLANLDEKAKKQSEQVLVYVLKAILIMIYPFSPFITEEIYQNLPEHLDSIMLESFPKVDETITDENSYQNVELLKNFIKDIRTFKIDENLAPNSSLKLAVKTLNPDFLKKFSIYLSRFSFSTIVEQKDYLPEDIKRVYVHTHGELNIIAKEDKAHLLAQIEEDIQTEEYEIRRAENMLQNPSFLAKAPGLKIEEEKNKLEAHQLKLTNLLEKKKQLLG